MAVQIHRIDDINGDSGAVTHVIVINGRGVEIDLGERSLKRLTDALAPFWEAGRETSYDVEERQGRTSRRKRDDADRDYDLAALRAWAAERDIALPARGRIPRDVIDQFQAAS